MRLAARAGSVSSSSASSWMAARAPTPRPDVGHCDSVLRVGARASYNSSFECRGPVEQALTLDDVHHFEAGDTGGRVSGVGVSVTEHQAWRLEERLSDMCGAAITPPRGA